MTAVPPISINPNPFTHDTTTGWRGTRDLGPVWITPDSGFTSGARLDNNVSPAMFAFITAAMAHADVNRNDYVCGTAYAVRIPIGCTAGTLHYDGGAYDLDRRVTRVVGTWAPNGTPLQNVFIRHNNGRCDDDLDGVRTDTVHPDLLIQPPNNHTVLFDEGIHLHGRAAVPPQTGLSGVFMSVALYRDGQAPDLHCPRLAALRGRGPHARLAAGYTSNRHTY